MPISTVEATLPFPADVASQRTSSFHYEPKILPLPGVADDVPPDAYETLLDEACDLARSLGCQVRRRLLGGIGGGCRWQAGRLRIVLDLESTASERLETVADALRGDQRLAWAEMSADLAAYLQPRRAA